MHISTTSFCSPSSAPSPRCLFPNSSFPMLFSLFALFFTQKARKKGPLESVSDKVSFCTKMHRRRRETAAFATPPQAQRYYDAVRGSKASRPRGHQDVELPNHHQRKTQRRAKIQAKKPRNIEKQLYAATAEQQQQEKAADYYVYAKILRNTSVVTGILKTFSQMRKRRQYFQTFTVLCSI